jgi:hypothetical protein
MRNMERQLDYSHAPSRTDCRQYVGSNRAQLELCGEKAAPILIQDDEITNYNMLNDM